MEKILYKIPYLPIKLTKKGLILEKEINSFTFESKKYYQYKDFFKFRYLAKDKKMYYIYRNVALKKDIHLFKREGLRYDLTLIFPGKINQEPIRTIGHFHKKKASEIYQVIYGSALFYFQDKDNKKAYLIKRNQGEKIYIPSKFGHITINPSTKKPLLVANIFSNKENLSDYSFFKKNHGPAWYPLIKEGKVVFEKNENYKQFPKISKNPLHQPAIVSSKSSLYKDFTNNPKKFSFLKI